MLNQFLSQPVAFHLDKAHSFIIRLSPSCSDFTVLEALSTPFAELVVTQVDEQSGALILRLPPFIELETQTSVEPRESKGQLTRCLGQGVRLYPHMATSPKYFIGSLRQGIELKVSLIERALSINLVDNSQFELVPLEQDLRLFIGPKVMMKAKALVARIYDYDKGPEMLALHRGEIELVLIELQQYRLNYKGSHAGLSAEINRLELQLREKSQWLSRLYSQAIERSSLGNSANCHGQVSEEDKLARKLEYYRLLAPSGVTDLVTQLMNEH